MFALKGGTIGRVHRQVEALELRSNSSSLRRLDEMIPGLRPLNCSRELLRIVLNKCPDVVGGNPRHEVLDRFVLTDAKRDGQ